MRVILLVDLHAEERLEHVLERDHARERAEPWTFETAAAVSGVDADTIERAATLYADSLFLLEPRRGTRDHTDPNVHRLHQVLEGILARDVQHPGACHLYVHATESTVVPGRAEACAQFLGSSIPGASHINHMPSHTWNEVGRWGDSVRANLEAWHSDLKADEGEGFAIYPDHNLHMLLYAASMDGQGGIATQAGKDYTKRTGDTMYQALTLIRFGRFDEVADVTKRPEREIPAAAYDFSQGYAKLKLGDADFAKAYLAKVKKVADTSKVEFRSHTAARLVGVLVGILDGEITRMGGDLNGSIAKFEQAVKLEEQAAHVTRDAQMAAVKGAIVVAGFEPVDILEGIALLVSQLEEVRAEVENQYVRSVSREGNRPAQAIVDQIFEPASRVWRGIGEIPHSGLQIRPAYAEFDAMVSPYYAENVVRQDYLLTKAVAR